MEKKEVVRFLHLPHFGLYATVGPDAAVRTCTDAVTVECTIFRLFAQNLATERLLPGEKRKSVPWRKCRLRPFEHRRCRPKSLGRVFLHSDRC